MYNKILDILEFILGSSKNGCSLNGQMQFNCPYCDANGDGKYNFECNVKGVYKCWKCEETGKLSSLIKEFGSENLFNEYKNEIENLRISKLYKLFNKDNEVESFETFLELPKEAQKLNINKHKEAYNYLNKRGIDENIINKFNIHCTTSNCEEWQLRNRIIIPSYNSYNSLNYFVCRLYNENKYQTKYYNPKTDKTKIIFNEKLINWDGNIYIVEGIFDHIVVPNSIPLLGKELKDSYYLYEVLMERANIVTLFLDREAYEDTIKIYKILNKGRLKNKVFIVDYNINIDNNPFLDPSTIYELYGKKGVIKFLQNTYQIDDISLMFE